MRTVVTMTAALALALGGDLAAAEQRPAVVLAAELVEARILDGHPQAAWLQAVADGLRRGEITISEAAGLVALIEQGATGTGLPLPAAPAGRQPDPAPAGDGRAEAAVALAAEPSGDDAMGEEPQPVDPAERVAELEAMLDTPPPPAADDPAPAAGETAAADDADPAEDGEAPAVPGFPDEPADAPAEATASATTPTAGDADPAAPADPAEPGTSSGETVAAATGPGEAEPTPPAETEAAADPVATTAEGAPPTEAPEPTQPAVAEAGDDPPPAEAATPSEPDAAVDAASAGRAVAQVVHVKLPQTPDDPELAMLEGPDLSKNQQLAIRRGDEEAVRLLVLRVEGTMAMAMVLAATWAEGAERPAAEGDLVYPVADAE